MTQFTLWQNSVPLQPFKKKMMENTVQPDKELEKQEQNKENQSAVPPTQKQDRNH